MKLEALGLIVPLIIVGIFAYRELRDDGYVDMFINWYRRYNA